MTVCAAGGMGHAMVDRTRMTTRPRPARHATLTTDVDDVLVVTIDRPGEPVNTLDVRRWSASSRACSARVDDDTLIKGVVLISGKPDSFIAGADIEQFLELKIGGRRGARQPHGPGAARPAREAARARRRRDSRRLSRRRSRGRRSPAAIASAPIIRRRRSRCRKCSSGSFPAWAARSGCRGASDCRRRST